MSRKAPANAWGLDLGTSNSGFARWDAAGDRVELVNLPSVAREPGSDDPLRAPRMVPSAVRFLRDRSWIDRLGARPAIARRFFWGSLAEIGRPALAFDVAARAPGFVRSFKSELATSPLQTLVQYQGVASSARDVARVFVRELLATVYRETGERVRDVTVTAPVDAYEAYRAEVAAALRATGVQRVHFVDEPVAAAVGYGLGLADERVVLLFDFGGGTMHLAAVRLRARATAAGQCEVLAKAGRPIGGQRVDTWLAEWVATRLGYAVPEGRHSSDGELGWQMTLLEACRVKESLFVQPDERFAFEPPDEAAAFDARIRGAADGLDVSRDDLVALLTERGLYSAIERMNAEVVAQLHDVGISPADISDVLMVGGSSLLPGVYRFFEQGYGRSRVRAFQPFEAVAMGAAVLGAGAVNTSDFAVHDYALVTHALGTHERKYEIIVPRGTRIPTPNDVWHKQLVPTCPMGVPESVFKLVVAELGADHAAECGIAWDEQGVLRRVGGGASGGAGGEGARVAVHLNEANPTLGTLDPPHAPGDTRPRLAVSFGVNEDRWLVVTVTDQRSGEVLKNRAPVIQVL